jgi:hypothetical protein
MDCDHNCPSHWDSWLILIHTDVREVGRDTLEPILFLLQSPDIEVQRAASAALGNLAVNGKWISVANERTIMRC